MAYRSFFSIYDALIERDIFRSSGGAADPGDFNKFDTPGHKYFKIFFYFSNGDSDNNCFFESDSGLLAPTWLLPPEELVDLKLPRYESAWAYLKRNCEDERAAQLKEFVNLLSNISTRSPWYFSEIAGLDAAIERKVMEDNLQIDAKRPKISIKCLHDSVDDRIGTLLDLYRSIVFSWTMKCQILPANLRKFDMGIFVFETPNEPFHVFTSSHDLYQSASTILMGKQKSSDSSSYKTSWKYYELHNCEIDYNSSKALTANLNNKEGFNPEYTIDIHFDDCYEVRYNEFLLREIGDMVVNDVKSWKFGLPDQNTNYYGVPEIDLTIQNEDGSIEEPDRIEIYLQRDNYKEAYESGVRSTYEYPTTGYTDYYNGDELWFKNLNDYSYSYSEPTDQNNEVLGNIAYGGYRKSGNQNNTTSGNITETGYEKSGNQNNTTSGNIGQDSGKIGNLNPNTSTDITYSNQRFVPEKPNPFVNALSQVVGTAKNYVNSKIARAMLGNLYTYSLTRMSDQLKAAARGDIWSTIRAVNEYSKDNRHRNSKPGFTDNNIFDNKPVRVIPSVKRIGSITKGKSIANNI